MKINISEHNSKFNRPASAFPESMGTGCNLGNSLDAYAAGGTPSENAWGNPILTETLIKNISLAGFRTVRCPISWMNYIDDNNGDSINETWLNRVQEVVNWIQNAGMYTIINIHHDGNNDFNNGAWLSLEEYPYQNPNWNGSGYDIHLSQTHIRKKYAAAWRQIAEKFRDYGETLVMESANELVELGNYSDPVASSTISNLNALNQLFVDTVRSTGGNNTNRLLLIAGYNTNLWLTTTSSGFRMPSDTVVNRLMLSVHYYDPWNFALNENNDAIFKWGDELSQIGDSHVDNWGGEAYVASAIQQLKSEFISKGIPVIVGEFGVVDKSHVDSTAHEYRRYYLEYVAHAILAEDGMVPVYWDNGATGRYGFALFERANGEPLYTDLIEAIVQSGKKSVRNLFSRTIFEDTFGHYLDGDGATSNEDVWVIFRQAWQTALTTADDYRNNITAQTLAAVENAYRDLVAAAKNVPVSITK